MTARILSLDTTSEHGSIALLESGCVVEEVPLHSPEGFGHVLFDSVATLLARHGWSLRDVECFAACAGPGSFTGVRVGLAAVKGLAESTHRRVAAVSTLQALAWFGTASVRAPVLDARRGEVYAAMYDERLEPLTAETVGPLARWLDSLPGTPAPEFLAQDRALLADALAGGRFAGAVVTLAPRALAGAVGGIANRLAIAGRTLDPADVDASYVRRSDAELFRAG